MIAANLAITSFFLCGAHTAAFAENCQYPRSPRAVFNITILSPSNGEVFTAAADGKASIPVKAIAKIAEPNMSPECIKLFFNPTLYVTTNNDTIFGNWDMQSGLFQTNLSLQPGSHNLLGVGITHFKEASIHHSNMLSFKVVAGPSSGPIQGNIDGFANSTDGRRYLQGWACDKNVARSIDLHMYVGGPAGSGQLVAASNASGAREAAVGQVCGTNGVGHGFSFDVTALSAQHAGKPIYIYGISTSGGANLAIGNSGSFSIPAAR